MHPCKVAVAFRESQHGERLPVVRLRPHLPVQARDGFHIVVEDVRLGVQHARHGSEITLKVGSENFDASFGKRETQRPNRGRKVSRAAVEKIVAIHAGDHHVAQAHLPRHPGDVRRLVRIGRAGMPALGDRTESAAARAQVAQDHEGRRAAMETFMQIGTARRFAHGVQIQPAKLGLEVMDGVEVRLGFAEPFGQTRRGGV